MREPVESTTNDDRPVDARERTRPAGVPQRINVLMTDQPYAVLCTQGQGQPYGSLIAFVVNPQLNAVVFTTPIGTYKFRQLATCDQVALVVDNRATCHPEEIMQLDALTATGRAVQIEAKQDKELWLRRLIAKHPRLKGFVRAPGSALFRIDISRYTYVSRLQRVEHWIPPRPVSSDPLQSPVD